MASTEVAGTGTPRRLDRLELWSRAIGVAGALLGLAWGVGWFLLAQAPVSREGFSQLLSTILFVAWFGRKAAGKEPLRWPWANLVFLSAIFAWRSSYKGYPLGVWTYSIMAGLALLGFLIATRQGPPRRDPG
jgi:hypothetical protein